MKLYLEKRVVFGFILTLAIILGLGIYSYKNNKKFAETSRLVSHTNEVLYHSEQILTMILAIEVSQRGYVITGKPAFLVSFSDVGDTIINHVDNVVLLTSDNTVQQPRLVRLKALVNSRISFANRIVEARKISFEAAKDSVASYKGKALTEEIQHVISKIQEEESALLKERIEASENGFHRFNYALIALLSITAFIIMLVFVTIHFSLSARSVAEEKLRKASADIQDLYENAPCGYHSLDAEGKFVQINNTMLLWLGLEKNDVVNKLNIFDVITPESKDIFNSNFQTFKENGFINNLEFDFIRQDGTTFPGIINATAIVDPSGGYAKSRTTVFDISDRKQAEMKVLQLNKELEAFTYSVSHDLRAPLRSINGYAQILEEDYASKLDDEGRRIIQIVITNAKRMGQLIDDLLDFSRVGRREVIKSEFYTKEMIDGVFSELMEKNGLREVDISIASLNTSLGDISMLRQVWVNLISNALKYTQKKPYTKIEIASYTEKNQIVYYIKDNGVGFDMQYKSKLFGVFQRLHKVQDFEGTGVGLAIVQRIVHKHGGAVWADAKVNEGATFYFSLPIE